MASSYEKSVKGATKIKAAPPKTKYIEHLLIATHSGDPGFSEVMRALQVRMRDSAWTVVFKSLITVHLMMREGSPNVALAYLARNRNTLAVSMFSDAQTQGRNIRHYANYLSERARAYRDTKIDWVRGKELRLEKLTVDKGLLRETETVQDQLTALLKCDVMGNELENEITVTVFRLLVLDLLALFQVLNQAMINILGHFFEMSKPDAARAMDIYSTFTRQTDFVVQYLGIARQYEHHTRVEVPKLKHAPINLGRQLEDYLKDPDFEIHRRQYMAEQEAKKKKGDPAATRPFENSKSVSSKTGTSAGASRATKPAPSNGPGTHLIDFFASIEQNQTPMAMQAQAVQQPTGNVWPPAVPFQQTAVPQMSANGFTPRQTSFVNIPFQQQNMSAFVQQQQSPPSQLSTHFTGAGFGGFGPQPSFQPSARSATPQDSVASFQMGAQPAGLQPTQTTNPFRASMLTAQQTAAPQSQFGAFSPPQELPRPPTSHSTNPFSSSTPPVFQQQPPAAPLQPMVTGTNPFARTFGTQPQQPEQRPVTAGGALATGMTGLAPQAAFTNPFRQGAFANPNAGMGWQHSHNQPVVGGLNNLQTLSVFPRPAQQAPWQP